MKDIHRLVYLLIVCSVACGVAFSTTGCDLLKGGGDDTEEDDDDNDNDTDSVKDTDKDEGKSDDDDPKSAPAESATPAAEEVASYPDQKDASGDYELLKPLKARQGADESATEQVELSSGTLITMRSTYQDWSLIDYPDPSDTTAKKRGWVHAQPDKNKDTFKASSESPSPSSSSPTPQPSSSAKPQPSSSASAKPAPKPSGGLPPIPKILNPCGCKPGDLACAMKCAQKGGKK